jgi:hypothetical protein
LKYKVKERTEHEDGTWTIELVPLKSVVSRVGELPVLTMGDLSLSVDEERAADFKPGTLVAVTAEAMK